MSQEEDADIKVLEDDERGHLQQKLRMMTLNFQRWKASVAEVEEANQKLRDEIDQLREESSHYLKSWEQESARYADYTKQTQRQIEQDRDQLHKLSDQISHLHDQIALKQTQRDTLAADIQQCKDDLFLASTQLGQLIHEKGDLEARLEAKTRECIDLKTELRIDQEKTQKQITQLELEHSLATCEQTLVEELEEKNQWKALAGSSVQHGQPVQSAQLVQSVQPHLDKETQTDNHLDIQKNTKKTIVQEQVQVQLDLMPKMPAEKAKCKELLRRARQDSKLSSLEIKNVEVKIVYKAMGNAVDRTTLRQSLQNFRTWFQKQILRYVTELLV